jgi:hypothetical protein
VHRGPGPRGGPRRPTVGWPRGHTWDGGGEKREEQEGGGSPSAEAARRRRGKAADDEERQRRPAEKQRERSTDDDRQVRKGGRAPPRPVREGKWIPVVGTRAGRWPRVSSSLQNQGRRRRSAGSAGEVARCGCSWRWWRREMVNVVAAFRKWIGEEEQWTGCGGAWRRCGWRRHGRARRRSPAGGGGGSGWWWRRGFSGGLGRGSGGRSCPPAVKPVVVASQCGEG